MCQEAKNDIIRQNTLHWERLLQLVIGQRAAGGASL